MAASIIPSCSTGVDMTGEEGLIPQQRLPSLQVQSSDASLSVPVVLEEEARESEEDDLINTAVTTGQSPSCTMTQ